jgi:hypothetical protein
MELDRGRAPKCQPRLGADTLPRSIPHLYIMDKTKSRLAAFFDDEDDEDDGSALPVRR